MTKLLLTSALACSLLGLGAGHAKKAAKTQSSHTPTSLVTPTKSGKTAVTTVRPAVTPMAAATTPAKHAKKHAKKHAAKHSAKHAAKKATTAKKAK